MSSYPQYALNKLNEDRLGKQIFCDFLIKTDAEEFPVHKCLLGVMSKFFQGMFQVEMKERYDSQWVAKDFFSDTISSLLDYLYGDSSSIVKDNVHAVLKAAHFMQISKLLEHCVEFLTNNMTDKNVFQNWEYARQYDLHNLAVACRKYSSKHFSVLSKSIDCMRLQLSNVEEFLQTKTGSVKEEQFYEAINAWVHFDIENRKDFFSALFDRVDLHAISKSFLNSEIAESDLVLDNPATSKKLVLALKTHVGQEKVDENPQQQARSSQRENREETSAFSKESEISHFETPKPAPRKKDKKTSTQKPSMCFPPESSSVSQKRYGEENLQGYVAPHQRAVLTKQETSKSQRIQRFVIMGGTTTPHYVRKSDATIRQWSQMKAFPLMSVDAKLFSYRQALYHIGGRNANDRNSFSDVFRLDVRNDKAGWKECADMHDRRHRFGSAFYKNQLYVAGGRAHKTENLSSVESYLFSEDRWIERSDMNIKRAGCCLVVLSGRLLAIGGQHRSSFYKSVEMLVGDVWITGVEMNHKRADFAAVSMNQRVYAIGGNARDEYYSSSVESFDGASWKFVASLNTPRAGHAACVLGDKIFVAGGENHRGPLKTIEMYSADEDRWEVIGEMKGDPVGISMVAL